MIASSTVDGNGFARAAAGVGDAGQVGGKLSELIVGLGGVGAGQPMLVLDGIEPPLGDASVRRCAAWIRSVLAACIDESG